MYKTVENMDLSFKKNLFCVLPDIRVDCSTWIHDEAHDVVGYSRHIEDLTWTASSALGSQGLGVACGLKMGWMWNTGSLEGVEVKEALLGENSESGGGPNCVEDGSCPELGTCHIFPPLIWSQGCSGQGWVFQGVRQEG